MKRIISIIAALALILTAGVSLAQTYTVGIGQFAQHGSLDNCYQGFIEGLAEAGIVEGENLKVELQNAQADMGIAQQIAAQFASAKVDMMVGIATPMAQACYNAAAGEIPTIFTAVTDPVAAGFADESGVAAGEVTGTSDALPIKAQLETIRAMLPEAKKIGILYTRTEANSVANIAEFEALAAEKNVQICTAAVNTANEIPSAIDTLLAQGVDCFNNLTDNTVVQNLETLLDKANGAGVPVFGSEIEQVEKGCVASCSLDYVELGRQTGYMIADILEGKSADDIPYLYLTDGYTVDYNSAACAKFGIELPASYADANDVA